MKLLILGGTLFLGRHFVTAALAAGYTVTVLHRGRMKTEPITGVEHLIGDRECDLESLTKGREWDVVVDTSCYLPRVMRASLEALRDKTGFYVFVSTISVYEFDTPEIHENSRTLPAVPENPEDVNWQGPGYGAKKRSCEEILQQAMPHAHLVVRPGIITGPYDFTCRATYWIERLHYDGPIVTMRDGSVPIQWIDARDLSEWALRMAQARKCGAFNLAGPERTFQSRQLYTVCEKIAGRTGDWVYLPTDFVKTLDAWHLPGGCLGVSYPEHDNFSKVSSAMAFANGLTCRDPEVTFADTYECARKWSFDYYRTATGNRSLYKPINEVLQMEKVLLEKYSKWKPGASRPSAQP
ncbi:MAG: NAD-dependent epimerase/dehydratase family protein [Rhodocyclaceae bacterium]